MRRAYNELGDRGFSSGLVGYALALVVAEISLGLLLYFGHRIYMCAFEASDALTKANVLQSQLANGNGQQGPPLASAGDAVARMRDDPHDLVMLVDNWVDVFGAVGYAIFALIIMATIDPLAAIVAVAPLVLVGLGNKWAGNRIRVARSIARSATSDSTDFLAAAFGASLTIKVSGASKGIVGRIDSLNSKRSRAMVFDQTWADALWTVNATSVDVCIGLALVVAARGVLSAGDVALFAAYAVNLIWLPQKLGGLVVGRRRFEVAAARLDAMLPAVTIREGSKRTIDLLTSHQALPVLGGPPMSKANLPTRRPLVSMSVRRLTCEERGLQDISFEVERGSLTVISGPVGSGKTSLLRAILGFLELDSGEILWNGKRVADRAAFFIPPQCAYVPQVPHLFSESLYDNLTFGSGSDPTNALRLAAFDEDVDGFSEGLLTVIGAGGVRLSGGQAQRAAATRALVQTPELLLFDDLTSALDVETEILLWSRLAEQESTVIAVSNRAVARARATTIIELG